MEIQLTARGYFEKLSYEMIENKKPVNTRVVDNYNNEDEITTMLQNAEALYGKAILVGSQYAIHKVKSHGLSRVQTDDYKTMYFNGFEVIGIHQVLKHDCFDENKLYAIGLNAQDVINGESGNYMQAMIFDK